MILLASASLFAAGCRQDMHNQPKFYPQRGTEFYADGRSARPQVANTVARGQLHEDSYFYTGRLDGKDGDVMPFAVTAAVLQRGQERYNIFCTPCHSRVGNGAGMIVQRGYKPAGNFHAPRIAAEPLGHYYDVIANGYGAMPDYSAQITVADRWAIVAYIKALQLSQNAKQSDVAPGAQVQPLAAIAEHEGLPASFAGEWELPATAVYGTPNGEDNAIPKAINSPGPGIGPKTPAQPALARPNAMAEPNAATTRPGPAIPNYTNTTATPQR